MENFSEEIKKEIENADSRETAQSKEVVSDIQKMPKNVQTGVVTFSKLSEAIEIGLIESSQHEHNEDPTLSQKDLLLAATLVTDAKNGQCSEFMVSDRSIKLYLLYHHWGFSCMLYFFIALHHFIAICEQPALEGFLLPFWVTMCLELACLFFYSFRLLHCASFLPSERFWRDKKHILVLSVLLLTVVDMCCYIGLRSTGYSHYAYRWSRPLRPVFMINFSENKQVRRAFRNIRKTLPDILNVLILFFISISLFTLMAQKLFQKRSLKFPDGKPYFVNYFDVYFDLYVLVTTANNPDIMMPAFDSNRWFAIFFIAYIIICLYIFMNIFLAVVYNNYRKHLKNEVRKLVFRKRQSLSRAFDLMKVKVNEKFVINYKRFVSLLNMIPPARSSMLISILWFVLDRDGDNQIGKADFLQLADLLNVAVSEVKDRNNIFDRLMPSCYHSVCSRRFRKIVSSKYFRYFFDLLILLNAFLIAFDVSDAEWCFLALFSLEIVSKIYAYGLTLFLKRFWNVFDCLVIGSAVIATAIESFVDVDDDEKIRTLDFLLVLRVLRLVKIIGGIARFQVIVTTIMNLGPSILTYGGVLFVVYYVFAIVGMELFQFKISYFGYGKTNDTSKLNCGNPNLNGTSFYQSQYCSNNFNNVISSFVVLFELMVVNQWHVLANGFVLVTTKAARLYFFAFHLICVIIVLNIFTAFVLEAFILEYSFSKSKLESAIEKKIAEMGLRIGKHVPRPSTEVDKGNLVLDEDFATSSDQESIDDDFSDENRRDSTVPNLSQETGIRFHLTKSLDGRSGRIHHEVLICFVIALQSSRVWQAGRTSGWIPIRQQRLGLNSCSTGFVNKEQISITRTSNN